MIFRFQNFYKRVERKIDMRSVYLRYHLFFVIPAYAGIFFLA